MITHIRLMLISILCSAVLLASCVDNSDSTSRGSVSTGSTDNASDEHTDSSGPEDHATDEDPAAADELADADSENGDEDAANPCEMSNEGEMRRVRGVVKADGMAYFFTECDKEHEVLVNDNADGSFMKAAPDIVGPDGLFYAIMDVKLGEATLKLERLWHAAPIGESHGCEEDLSNIIYKASGNEPFWGITVYSDGLLMLRTPEAEWSFNVSEMSADENFVNITAVPMSEGDEITMEFAAGDCQDSMSGAWSSMIATVIHGEKQFGGCAWVGEAMGMSEGE